MALTEIKTGGIDDDAVTQAKMAPNAVITETITDASVSIAKMAHESSSNSGKFLRANNGAACTWETVSAGTALTGSTNNTITTVTGANAITGEANLTFDGTTLGVSGLTNTGGQNANALVINRTDGLQLFGVNWNVDANEVTFSGNTKNYVFKNGSSSAETCRIDSSGDVLIGRTSSSTSHPLCVQSDSNAEAIAVIGRSSDDISAIGFFENDTTTNLGEIQYRQDHVNVRHRVGDIRFATGGTTERVRIHGDGHISQYATPYGYINYAADGSASDNGEFTLEEQTSHHDEGGMNIGATNRMTVPYTGIYLIAASIGIEKSAGTNRPRINLKLNGSTILSQELEAGRAAGGWNTRAFSQILSLSANDYLDISAVGKCDGGNYAKSQIVLLYGK